ncbi:MAG: hypothetical protein KDA57_04390 [Planctomycetales bacterium]|nr:hypothetical protein [Planctomycetales bacterium]
MNHNRSFAHQAAQAPFKLGPLPKGLTATLALLLLFAQAPCLPAQEAAPPATTEAAAPAETQQPATETAPATENTGEQPAAEAPTEGTAAATPGVTNREKVAPDAEGRIQFSYVAQPWAQVLQDYADAAGFSLDWQELPSDSLNLTTQHTYSLAEARDLLNRHLLARGFTMLNEGEVLSVVKVDKLDPSLIPRAEADELENFAPHEFMRVTFNIPVNMEPGKAAEDVKVLLSPNAKVTPLLASRRLLVIDAVTNLRDVRSLMYAERQEDSQTGNPREYVLKYRRADYVAEQVLVVIGLDPNVIKTPDELKLETQRLQMQMKLIEKAQDVSKMIKDDGPQVYIAVNRQRNSILVNAPADLMAVVERTVKQLDVPDEAGVEGEAGLSMKQYQLVMADPNEIIKALEDIVRLDPRSRLQGDLSSKTLLATATQADHLKIQEIIEKLDVTMPPTIEIEKLGELEPHDVVRVRFKLPLGIAPAEISAKLQPVLSTNAKVLPLQTSRELLVIDTVEKLVEAKQLIAVEEAAFAAQDNQQEFAVKHRRVEDVAGQVLTALGLSPAGLSNPQGVRLDYQGLRLIVTVNTKANSFRASAHPELLDLISQSVERFDIPETEASPDAVPAESLVIYDVIGQDINSLITMLRDIGGVGPLARMQAGPAPGTLYAIANEQDQEKIRSFLEKIAPEVIQTVAPEKLESLPRQKLFRVRFQLPLSAVATTVAAELRGITTPRGIVQSLESSKQIIVLDTAENLINIREVVDAEVAALETQSIVREFPLEHRSATEMVEQVLAMLGLDPATVSSPYQLRMELQTMKLFITANQQRNSLIVNASPDKLELVEKIIKQLDVPQPETPDSDANRLSMVPYKVTGQNVTVVVETLQTIGNLSPRTQLHGDPSSLTLYAYADQADHEKIRKFVEKIDPNAIVRVEADQLEQYAAQERVRVRFQLPLTTDMVQAAAQVRSILGVYGRVQSLDASKQLIVDDTAANLIEVRDVLAAESEAMASVDVFQEYPLEHRRAEVIAEQLLTMLELGPTPISPQGARFTYRGMKLFVAIKPERNSLLIGARPELIKLVGQIIKQFDVAEGEASPAADGSLTMELYEVPGQNVLSVIEMVRKLAELGPLARLDAGPAAETFYAIASAEDHEKIRVFLEKIAPPTVRTVEAEELDTAPAHELVRVRFQMPLSATVATIAVQLQGLTTPRGIVQSFESSKQIIVTDTAENLIKIREVLKAESAALATQSIIKEFPLKHRRATEIVEQVLTMLGFDPATVSSPYQLRIELQAMKLFVTANQQRNSIMVNASPDKLEIVEKIIEQLDVPESIEAVADEHRLTLVPYKLDYIDVTSAEKALLEIGGIGPTAKLQGDPVNRTLYAYATRSDHERIEDFINKTKPKVMIQIEPDKLEEHSKRDLGRVIFQLPQSADVTTSANMVRGLLGPKSLVQPLEASKQLVVVDSVERLLEVREVLRAEAAALATKNNIREFPLEHRRAEEMVEQVLTMLGIGKATISSPYELRNELRTLNLYITANQQRNSLVVNGEADKIELVERIVKQLDVPDAATDSSVSEGQFMVPYKVTGQDVTSMVKALTEIGNLGPKSRLQGDPVSQTLYAFATKEEHERIREFVSKIDPNFIRQVEPDQLEEYTAHELARVRFQLPPTADMQLMSTQIQGIVGPTGRVQALDSSNQLVVIDTVANLIGVRDVLRVEEAALLSQKNIREFPLQHRRAIDMVDQVLTMLGASPELISNPVQMQQELQRLKLYITANEKRNSLVVNAPDDKMLTVEQIVTQLDVPENGEAVATTSKQTMVPYHLAVGDVTATVTALMDIGGLDPRTRLQSNPLSQTIYAYASKADHEKIRNFLDEMDPNVVRRVNPDDLEDSPAHELVRVLFQLPLSADINVAARQIEGVLGEGARVQSLESSKQLVIVDTVANLIDVRDLLYGEQLAAEALEMPMIFPLQHRRATYVADQVMILLGLDPSARKTSTEVQFEAQRMQMMMQEASRSGRDISKIGDQQVYIAVNQRQNSLLVNAPPEKIPLIERTIEQIDVPVGEGGRIASKPMKMEKYQMITSGADGVIRTLEEIGALDPKTQMQTDATGKVIYAYATEADHITIEKMIAKLDGSGRRTEVRWLPPSLPADQVAGSIMALVLGSQEKKEDNLPFYYFRYRDDTKEEDLSDGFRVLPDVENNRLLLWVTDAELEEVDNLIAKLSERVDSSYNDRRKVRRLEARDAETTRQLLEQLRSTWSGENKLEIQPPPEKNKPASDDEDNQEDKVTDAAKVQGRFASQPTWLAQVVDDQTAKAEAPPIKITVNENGEIVLASEDTAALDQLQVLIDQLSPVQTEFRSFQLLYISVVDVVYNLEIYFQDELGEDKGESIVDWFGRRQQTKPEPAPLTLGKRPPIRFVDDPTTNTLLVANASPTQMRVIEEMIKLYDRPPNPDLYYRRKTEAVQIKYSRAEDIVVSLKEVYRDLLSSRDKEFQTQDGKQSVISRESSYIFGDARRTVEGSEGPVLVKFSGALSIGVDEVSNSVVISAREEVLEEIKQTISVLDQAAKPETVVRIHSANGVLNADDLQRVIAEALSEPWLGGQPGPNSSNRSGRRSRSRSVSP